MKGNTFIKYITKYYFIVLSCDLQNDNVKGKGVPLQARCGPEGSRRSRLPDFHYIRHMKVVRLSASSTGHLYTQEMFLVLIFTRG